MGVVVAGPEPDCFSQRFDGVAEAIVEVRDDLPGGRALIAFVRCRDGGAIDRKALRAALGARLPSYMVPAFYAQVPSFPLTTNGKIDRK